MKYKLHEAERYWIYSSTDGFYEVRTAKKAKLPHYPDLDAFIHESGVGYKASCGVTGLSLTPQREFITPEEAVRAADEWLEGKAGRSIEQAIERALEIYGLSPRYQWVEDEQLDSSPSEKDAQIIVLTNVLRAWRAWADSAPDMGSDICLDLARTAIHLTEEALSGRE